ncbi:Maleylacetoacetate isomerase [Aspergillus heteromorphus CBS 117.55]|uniref:Maleylacetoacetate isomerase n=1 Tax=Aspergillus heteromorphus CBS 117.55 TaxID=1448321 RepID=A0A317VV34_9EURO|nr:Maleylacetoacetate isomerase [Aspergillus heteromorphus CBS 117.55]PWY78264.1 Maleylacetoacetate isomerase [Aspergillus heteromorphus CBS 117.55]
MTDLGKTRAFFSTHPSHLPTYLPYQHSKPPPQNDHHHHHHPPTPLPSIQLHTYFRSSCSARLRIALHLKSLPYTSIPINLLANEQHSPKNTSLNPSATVPTLILTYPSPTQPTTITIPQSLSALEYLEETLPSSCPALLPPRSSPHLRATVRTLAYIIAVDIQPVTNLRILKRVAPLGMDRETWSRELIEEGLRAYETIAASSAGRFSVGDSVTLADVCLLPAVWGAERVGVDLGMFPTVERVRGELEGLGAVREAHWRAQGDTPGEFRV